MYSYIYRIIMKSNVLVCLIFLIISNSIPKLHAKCEQTKKVMPGITSCMYYGSLDRCSEEIVPVDTLPAQCTSFFMDGIFYDNKYFIQNSYSESDGEHILELTTTPKPVFIFYGYQIGYPWSNILDCVLSCSPPCPHNLATESKAIQDYVNVIPIKGLVLKNVFEEGNANLDNISMKLSKYVKYMRNDNPLLSYGLAIGANYLQKQKDLDFCILCKTFDFIVITLDQFNQCSADYKQGIAPVNNSTGNTLTKIASILSDASVPKEKIYYLFALNPQVENHKGPGCQPTNGQKCTSQIENYDLICADTSSTFYSKGEFIRCNAAGFIGAHVDIDDVNGDCKCGLSYPAFNFILNGYNGGKKQTCELFDKES